MGMSADAPWSDMSYKLVEYDHRPVLKLSTGKESCPGRKQIFRIRDGDGNFTSDVIGLRQENLVGESLLKEYVRDGRPLDRRPSLLECRKSFADDFAALPNDYKAIHNPRKFPVEISPQLSALRERTEKNQRGG
jgi:nicotinate phosphoribosyltransferase